ncbi:antA/AntB antirepressor family protein [Vibrio cholerae]|nr:antA/AntB antirepressor family protein [Vibrio cholerae]
MNTQKSPIQVAVFESQIGGVTKRCVDARELHQKLENATRFDQWIARKIEDFAFGENEDFRSFLTESSGGRPATEYTISIDMAKELCMLERSEIGRATRKYFIECERKLIQAHSITPNQAKLLKGEIEDCKNKLKRADNEYDEKLYKEFLDLFYNQLQMPQPPIELLDVKKEKAE